MTNAEKLYRDIIDLPRPEDEDIFTRYPRMPLSERAKIFRPFAALKGYEERIAEEERKSSAP